MRKLLGVLVGVVVTLLLPPIFLLSSAFAEAPHSARFVVGRASYEADGRTYEMDATPFIESGRTYVPVRYLALALGVADKDVLWDEKTKSVTLKLGDTTVELTIGSPVLYINGNERLMDVTPVLRGGRTYLPARWVAESFGFEVNWVPTSREVVLSYRGGRAGLYISRCLEGGIRQTPVPRCRKIEIDVPSSVATVEDFDGCTQTFPIPRLIQLVPPMTENPSSLYGAGYEFIATPNAWTMGGMGGCFLPLRPLIFLLGLPESSLKWDGETLSVITPEKVTIKWYFEEPFVWRHSVHDPSGRKSNVSGWRTPYPFEKWLIRNNELYVSVPHFQEIASEILGRTCHVFAPSSTKLVITFSPLPPTPQMPPERWLCSVPKPVFQERTPDWSPKLLRLVMWHGSREAVAIDLHGIPRLIHLPVAPELRELTPGTKINNRAMVPVRSVLELFGTPSSAVAWNGRVLSINLGERKIVISLDAAGKIKAVERNYRDYRVIEDNPEVIADLFGVGSVQEALKIKEGEPLLPFGVVEALISVEGNLPTPLIDAFNDSWVRMNSSWSEVGGPWTRGLTDFHEPPYYPDIVLGCTPVRFR